MAVKLRLTRVGSKKNPVYRIVAADSRSPRDGRFLEIVGRYNPQTEPSTIELDAPPLPRGAGAHDRPQRPRDPALPADHLPAIGLGDVEPEHEDIVVLDLLDPDRVRLVNEPPRQVLEQLGHAK